MKRAKAGQAAGWTLTELLVVLAVIVALSALAMPMTAMVRARFCQAGCLQNLRQIGDAIQMYAGDHGGSLPTMAALRPSREEEGAALDNTLGDYLADGRVFRCPADTKKRLWETTGTSYHWNSALNGQNVNGLQFMGGGDISRIPFVGDKEGFHEGCAEKVNILYADGRSTNKLKFR
jgi:type II secretory pathway pseudopilin PulG